MKPDEIERYFIDGIVGKMLSVLVTREIRVCTAITNEKLIAEVRDHAIAKIKEHLGIEIVYPVETGLKPVSTK